jgi:hypothetical protein
MFFSVFFIADFFLPRKEGIKGMEELGCDTLPLPLPSPFKGEGKRWVATNVFL